MIIPNCIALYSPAPQSGKSTVAEFLHFRFGHEVVSFASPLKAQVEIILQGLHYAPELIKAMLYGDKKGTTIPELGCTARELLIKTGDGVRKLPTVPYTAIAQARIDAILDHGGRVVVDDMRFHDEFKMLHDRGLTVKVVRPEGAGWAPGSEGLLDHHEFDRIVLNQGSIMDLREAVMDELIR